MLTDPDHPMLQEDTKQLAMNTHQNKNVLVRDTGSVLPIQQSVVALISSQEKQNALDKPKEVT